VGVDVAVVDAGPERDLGEKSAVYGQNPDLDTFPCKRSP
jgi:hypothetical protein